MATFLVTIPAGVVAGQVLSAPAPDGQTVQFAIPPGVVPGQQIQVPYTSQAATAPVAVAMPVAGAAPMMVQGAAPMMAPMMMAPAAPMMMAPGQQYMPQPGGVNYYAFQVGVPMDPWAVLRGMDRVVIKQQLQLLEVIVGWEMAQKFLIADGNQRDVFIAAERQNGIMGMLGRQALDESQRPFTMDIAMLTGPGMQPAPFIRLERPYTCTCCCFNRPRLNVYNAFDNRLLGYVTDPWTCCCQFKFTIHDAMDNEILKIDQSACSCAMCCWGWPCGCQKVDFAVIDSKTGQAVGNIQRQFNSMQALGMVTGVNMDADQFQVDFHAVQAAEWKAVLIGAAMDLEYRKFGVGGQERRDESVGARLL